MEHENCMVCFQKFENYFYGQLSQVGADEGDEDEEPLQVDEELILVDKIILECRHTIHYNCLFMLVEKNFNDCPMCRRCLFSGKPKVLNRKGFACEMDVFQDLWNQKMEIDQLISLGYGLLYLITLKFATESWCFLISNLFDY
jgi:hypothetical protein